LIICSLIPQLRYNGYSGYLPIQGSNDEELQGERAPQLLRGERSHGLDLRSRRRSEEICDRRQSGDRTGLR